MHAPIVETLAQARQTLATIEKLANKLDAGLDPLMADIARSLDGARGMMDTGRVAIVRLQQDASAMLAQGTSLARDGREQLAARGAELSQTMHAAEQAFHSANALFVTAGSMVAPRSRERDDFDAALRDLASSISYLRGFSQALDRDPSILLRGRAER
jgi:ABC-type transporter Mla subunit MlaD